jgi:C-terminal processing protease CtpA/Prc
VRKKLVVSLFAILAMALSVTPGTVLLTAKDARAQGASSTPSAKTELSQTVINTADKGSRRSQRRFEKTYQRVWTLVKDNYYNRKAVRDWDSWLHRFDGKLSNRDELVNALNEMLGSLHDDYSYVLSERNVEQRSGDRRMRRVAQSRLIDGDIAYVRLRNFSSEHCEQEFKDALSQVAGANGIVLDLRNNHGGYIETAERLFEMLADRGNFISYFGYQDGMADSLQLTLTPRCWDVVENGDRTTKPRGSGALLQRPIIVLVNQDTRSAAELLTGALRANKGALVVGSRTFGKGVLQDSFEVGNDVQVKITTARYFLPDGEDIHNKGITPDVGVAESQREDLPLNRAVGLLRKQIASASVGTDHAIALSQKSVNENNM